MAFEWVIKVRQMIPGKKTAPPSRPGEPVQAKVTPPVTPAKDQPHEQTSRSHPTWVKLLVDQTPIMMLVAGGLMSACAQLIQAWALLGFLLLASAPIVYWLRRVERRIEQLTEALEKK